MILSFGWTWPALVTRDKDTTRRNWKPRTLASYLKAYQRNEPVQAWDKCPCFGGKQIGVIRQTVIPQPYFLSEMPDDDYRREGFLWFSRHMWALPPSARKKPWGACTFEAFDKWRTSPDGGSPVVVRYEILDIFKDAVKRLADLESAFADATRREKGE